MLEAQQRKEVKQAIQLQEKMRALEFREKVGAVANRVWWPLWWCVMLEEGPSDGAGGGGPGEWRAKGGRHWAHCSPACTQVPPLSKSQPCLYIMLHPLLLQVLESEYEAQKNVAPFLKHPVLRRIVQVGVVGGRRFTQYGGALEGRCHPAGVGWVPVGRGQGRRASKRG